MIDNIYNTDITNAPITVRETIPLKAEYATAHAALLAGQAYDDAADDNAHGADGYIDHARFFFEPASGDSPARLILFYPWRDRESLDRLLQSETALLAPWFEKFAAGRRVVTVLNQLPVDI